jgi:hypothetical protein
MVLMPTVFATKPKSSHHLLHSFCLYPSLRFETQAEDETVVLVLRAHPITQLGWIFTSLIILFLPLFFNIFLINYLSGLQIFFINLFWYVFLFSYIFLNILNYLFNVGIVTNRRIIDVDFHQILYKEVTASSISKIEDVTVKSAGFIPSFFNYGNLFVQTAGEEQNIEFLNIPNPTEAASVINKLMKSVRGHGP